MFSTRQFSNSTASLCNLLNNCSSAAFALSSTGSSNTTDNWVNPKSIDFTSKEVIIGTSCIGAGMLGILILFFVLDRKNRNITQETFSCIIKKNHARSLGDRLIITKLGIDSAITPEDQHQIEEEGLRHFCKEQIKKTIAQRIADDEPIQTNYLASQVVSVFFNRNDPGSKLGKFDLLEDILFEYNPNNKHCNFFNTILPPITKATILFEMLFGTVQMLGSLQLTPPILPISREVNNKIILAQTIFDLLFMLFIVYTGAGQAFVGDLGASIDNFFVNLIWRRKSKEIKKEVDLEKLSKCTKAKIKVANTVLFIFVINNLYSEILTDYQQTISLNDKINGLGDAIIPPWAVYLCSMIEFGLNQLNDPVQIFSQIFMGLTLINIYFSTRDKLKPKARLEEIKTDEVKHNEDESRMDSIYHLPATLPEEEHLDDFPKSNTVAQLQADMKATLLPQLPIKKTRFCSKLFSCYKNTEQEDQSTEQKASSSLA